MAEPPTLMDADDAREFSESLSLIGKGWVRQIQWAYQQRIPEAEGLTRSEWRRRYYGDLKLGVDDRREEVRELTDAGHTAEETAEILGVTEKTVDRDRAWLRGTNVPSEPDGEAAEQESTSPAEGQMSLPAGQEHADAILADIDQQNAEQAEDVPDDHPEPEADDESEAEGDPPAEPEPPRIQLNEGDEWYTPKWLFDALGIEKFAIDVCAPPDLTHSSVPAERHLTIEDDGLAQPWDGIVWCNPPYSKPEPWARRMIHHRNGLLLTHIPMNAGWCVDMWEACDAIRLFQAMEFVRPDGSSQRPGYWLQLAAFGPVATEALARLQPLGQAAANKRRVASPMWRRAE